jgi:hypothetical protein
MIEDMTMRGFNEHTRRDYVRHVRSFAAFIGRSPDTATAEDLRFFQLHQTQSGMQPASYQQRGLGPALLTLDRPDLSRRWREGRRRSLLLPRGWLFPGRNPVEPLSACQLCRAVRAAGHQFAVISGLQLSAIFTKPSAGNPAAATNPHRRSSVHRFPAGSFFRGFRTPALYRIDRSCSGRHPKPFRNRDTRTRFLRELSDCFGNAASHCKILT